MPGGDVRILKQDDEELSADDSFYYAQDKVKYSWMLKLCIALLLLALVGGGAAWSLNGFAIMQKPASGIDETQKPVKPTITPDKPPAKLKDFQEQMFRPGEKFDAMLKKMREKTKDIPKLNEMKPGEFGPAKVTNDIL